MLPGAVDLTHSTVLSVDPSTAAVRTRVRHSLWILRGLMHPAASHGANFVE